MITDQIVSAMAGCKLSEENPQLMQNLNSDTN